MNQACELLCGGNHRLVEAIFYENSANCYETVAWQQLKMVGFGGKKVIKSR